MSIVNMLEAKSTLSRLVEAVENGIEREIIIARNGKAAARIVPVNGSLQGKRIGVAKGKFRVPASIDQDSEKVAKLFRAGQ